MNGLLSSAFSRGIKEGNASHLALYSSAAACNSHFLNDRHFGHNEGDDVSESRSSRIVLRYSVISSECVATVIPSAAKAVQAATCSVLPSTSTSTRHIRQVPCGPTRSS